MHIRLLPGSSVPVEFGPREATQASSGGTDSLVGYREICVSGTAMRGCDLRELGCSGGRSDAVIRNGTKKVEKQVTSMSFSIERLQLILH